MVLWLGGVGLVAAVYLVFKMFAMNWYLGDEHIYTYQARLVATGVTPYAEFAMAHPPLQALFAALVFMVTGLNPVVIRLLPILWGLAGGVLLALLVRRELGRLASVAAMAFFLLSYEPLRATSHFTGVNMTVALLLAAFLAYRQGAVRTSAGFCTAAVFTRLYAIPGVLALVFWAFVEHWRKGVRLTAWGAGMGLSAFLALGLWAGFGNVVSNLVLYHAQKTPMSAEGLRRQNLTVLFHNAPTIFLFLAGLLALLVLGWLAYRHLKEQTRRGGSKVRLVPYDLVAIATLANLAVSAIKGSTGWVLFSIPLAVAAVLVWSARIRRTRELLGQQAGERERGDGSEPVGIGLLLLCAMTTLVFLAILLNMERVWMYYYIPAFPFAAVVGGWLVSRWVLGGITWAGRLIRSRRLPPHWLPTAAGLLLLVAYLASWWVSPNLERNLRYYQQSMTRPASQRVHGYTWRPGMLPDPINRLVRALCWKDQRVIGERYNRFNYLLWHESRTFDQAQQMADLVRSHTGPEDRIFGDSSSVPLLALLSERTILDHEVDTNIMRYRGDPGAPQQLVERIDQPENRVIVLSRGIGVGSLPEVQRLVQSRYRPLGSFPTDQDRTLTVYLRQEED
ncbi:MAG: hypothetical protein JW797_17495 [Bradymonadales bacterium]|nr:hypothetical protein [Bradymonadales bacterium]